MAIINDTRVNPDNPEGLPRPTRTTTPFETAQATAPAAPAAPTNLSTPDTYQNMTGGATATTSTVRAPRPRGGIVNGAAPVTPPPDPTAPFAPQGPAGSSINPVTHEVGAQETVQGQLSTILKNGNPLLEAAKARAAQAANARGLQNSSMAVQSGEEAMVNTALPIAQADASAYQKQALVNQDITNQFLSQDKGAKLDLEAAYAAFQKNNYMFDKDEKLKRYINDSGISSNEKIAAMQAAAQVSSASIGASASMYGSDKRLEEAGMNNEAAKLMQQAGFTQQDLVNTKTFERSNFQQYASFMNQIQLSEMPVEAKQAYAKSLTTMYTGSGLLPPNDWDLSAFPDTTTSAQP